MKKIKILFSKSKFPKLKKFSANSENFFKARIKNSDFKIKNGGVFANFDRKNNYSILTHLGTNEYDFNDLQNLGAKGVRKAIGFQGEDDIEINLMFEQNFSREERKFIEKGALMAEMKDDWYKSKEKNAKKSGTIEIKGVITKNLRELVEAINIAREIQSKPSNKITPVTLEEYIKKNIDKKEFGLKITYHQQDFLGKEKMGLFLAVNQGSKDRAKMIQFEYNGGKKGEAPVVLIGKGLTYDSGGYYMKGYPHMNEMNGDMGGAATVIGIMASLKKLGIKKNVVGIIGVTENMVDANSYKNGDILTARNGKTVYVGHTDAEGRLVLADCLSYADDTFKPKMIFDFATLTGSCHHSLGEMYTGIFSDDKKLLDKIEELGRKTNDLCRQLPFDKRIKEAVKHKQADLSNVGKFKFMGAGEAAAFLSNFVKDTKKWVHCDIAGTGIRETQKQDYDLPNSFGTGTMITLMTEFLKK
ncbi:leucyl aminopeptidase family protein [Candidatus Gracilibacteria bacterium]|nr:leucyl aminopeptidase family protein [Candidatus Gracilibacteria bacterium]